MGLLSRFPILIWAGGGLLGWVAGEMVATDPALIDAFGAETMHSMAIPLALGVAIAVLAVGFVMRRRAAAEPPEQHVR